jgi:RNA polymerase sigma factor (TIGR02999 family)
MNNPPPDPRLVTQALRALREDDAPDLHELLPAVYDELRLIAGRHMSGERPDHTLQPTALLHEAWIRISANDGSGFANRGQFFAIAARAMRQVLIDHARRRGAEKRGGDQQRVTLLEDIATDEGPGQFDLLDLHDAIEKLAERDPGLGKIIELRFFGGLTLDETAEVLEISRRKVAKDWSFARVWLARELSGDD